MEQKLVDLQSNTNIKKIIFAATGAPWRGAPCHSILGISVNPALVSIFLSSLCRWRLLRPLCLFHTVLRSFIEKVAIICVNVRSMNSYDWPVCNVSCRFYLFLFSNYWWCFIATAFYIIKLFYYCSIISPVSTCISHASVTLINVTATVTELLAKCIC